MADPEAGWKLLEGMTLREVTYVPITKPPFIAAAAYLATLVKERVFRNGKVYST